MRRAPFFNFQCLNSTALLVVIALSAWSTWVFAQQSVSELVRQLQSKDPSLCIQAAQALGQLDSLPQEARSALIKTLKHKNPKVRGYAAQAIGVDKEAVPPLIELLKDHDEFVRESGAAALEKIGPDAKTARPALVHALKDKGMLVRFFAALALVEIDPTTGEAVNPLVEVLNQKSGRAQWFRHQAAEALRKIGTPQALKALKGYEE
jgi:HEAT repeat protein